MKQINKKLTIVTIMIFFALTIFLVGCSNKIIQPNEQNQTNKPNCPQEAVICVEGTVPQSYLGEDGCNHSKCIATCANEGERFSSVYKEYPEHCCSGLTEWSSGMDTGISIADKCYATGLLSGNPVGTCIKCGDGVCDANENPCNCPSDCVGKEKSTFKTINEFCDDAGWKERLNERTELNKDIYDLCTTHCANAGELVGINFPSNNCCIGLTKLIGVVDITNCLAAPNGVFTCSDCGNAICETWENKCNCAQDCN